MSTNTNVIELQTLADYNTGLADNSLVVVYFWASWCSACAESDSQVNPLSLQYPQIKFYKLDIQNTAFTSLLAQYSITNFPTFLYMFNGNEVNMQVGANLYLSTRNTARLAAEQTTNNK